MNTYTTVQMLEAVTRYRNGKAFEAFLTRVFCPRVMTFDTREVYIDKVLRNKRIAPFVAPVVAGRANVQDGFETFSYKPPYVKPKDIVEPQQFFTRRAGEAMGGALTPEQRLNLTRIEILNHQFESISIREEEMISQMVQVGTITCEGEDHPTQIIDMHQSASNNITLTGAARWSQLDADTSEQPRDDLSSWANLCKVAPNMLIFGSESAYHMFAKFKVIKDERDTQTRGTASSFLTQASNGEQVQYKGMYGNYALWVYTGSYDDKDGNEVKFLEDNRMIMCSSNTNGAILYGAIQDMRALRPMSRFPKNWEQQDPSVEFIMTQSAPLPVIPSMDDFVTVNLDGGV